MNSSDRRVNVAVVGLGLMGVTHLKAYQQISGARIVAVADNVRSPVDGILAGASGNVGGADAIMLGPDVRAYQRLEDVLADPEVELVDLCVPTPLHAPQSLAALKAGKHVLCEKPMARNSTAAREIMAAAGAAQGFFMPAMCMRFWPGWSCLKELVTQRTYGKVLAARFRRVSAPPVWGKKSYFNGAESGGALLDMHIHDSDFVQFLFGRPKQVFSSGRTQFSGAIDHVVTQYEVVGGAIVHAEGSWVQTRGFAMSYTVNFERATYDFDSSRGADALRVDEENGESRILKFDQADGYFEQIKHFVESVQAGIAPRVVTPADGVSATEICEAEELSIQRREPVAL